MASKGWALYVEALTAAADNAGRAVLLEPVSGLDSLVVMAETKGRLAGLTGAYQMPEALMAEAQERVDDLLNEEREHE